MRIWIGLAALAFTAACAANPKPAVQPPAPSAPSAPPASATTGPLEGKSYRCASSSMSLQLILAANEYEVRNAAKGAKAGKGKLKVSGDTFTPLSGPLVGQVGRRNKAGAIEFEAELMGTTATPLTCTAG